MAALETPETNVCVDGTASMENQRSLPKQTRVPKANRLGFFVLAIDLIIVAGICFARKQGAPPIDGNTNTSAAVGWLGALGASFIFGGVGINMKSEKVKEAKIDPMVFQVYYSLGCALMFLGIWCVARQDEPFVLSWWGIVFAFLWVNIGLLSYIAIGRIGYAVAPAIWSGVGIITSICWGGLFFGQPIVSLRGTMVSAALLMLGSSLSAASGSALPETLAKCHNARRNTCCDGEGTDLEQAAPLKVERSNSAWQFFVGTASAILLGLFDGSLMVPLECFQHGCFGSQPYAGGSAVLAFAPSVAVGVVIATPLVGVIYFAVGLCFWQRKPNFSPRVAATPGILTGMYWAMGSFSALNATEYLGQVIGFPLTQTCVIWSGLWGILYFREMSNPIAIGIFALSVACLLSGSVTLGRFG